MGTIPIPLEPRSCPNCGAEFFAKMWGKGSGRRFCSAPCSCRYTAKFEGRCYKPKHPKVCEVCLAAFSVEKNELHRRFCSKACRARWQVNTPSELAKMGCPKGVHAGERNPSYGKSPSHGKWQSYVRMKDGQEIRLRSTWEGVVASYLDKKGINWEYETRRFKLVDRTYCPDFFLSDLGVFWEVKGWLHEKHRETIRQFRALYPRTPLVVIGCGCMIGMAQEMQMPMSRPVSVNSYLRNAFAVREAL